MKISTFLQKKNHEFIGLFTFRMHNSKLMDLKNVTRGHFGAKMAKKQTKFLTSQQAVRTQGTYRCLGVNEKLQDLILGVLGATMRFWGCWSSKSLQK